MTPSSFEHSRIEGAKRYVTSPWFERLKELIDIFDIVLANIWDMGEAGLQAGKNTIQTLSRGSLDQRTSVVANWTLPDNQVHWRQRYIEHANSHLQVGDPPSPQSLIVTLQSHHCQIGIIGPHQ